MPGENAHTLTSRVMELKSELEDLERKENMLDQQKFWVEQSIRNTREDCSKYPFKKPEKLKVQEFKHFFVIFHFTVEAGTFLRIKFKLKMRNG